MTTFVYIDYGPTEEVSWELRYSLATLLEEYAVNPPEVVVYTDKPDAYAGVGGIRVRPFDDDFARWTRDGLYAHRVKPCVLRDALQGHDAHCVLVDTDTFFRRGFADALARVAGVAMDQFERRDPCPELAAVPVELPNSRSYVYDPTTALMFNSGLISAYKDDMPIFEDALALIDAWLDAEVRQFNIEQIAVSESFRLHGRAIAEMKTHFEHYYRRSQKLYMRPRIAAWLAAGASSRPSLEPSKLRVRSAHFADVLLARLAKIRA